MAEGQDQDHVNVQTQELNVDKSATSEQSIHPETLENETPSFLTDGFNLVTGIAVQYGWFILLGVAIIFYLRHRYRSQISQYFKEKSDKNFYKKYDTQTTLARQEARQRALMRMQEENDVKAKEWYEKEQQKEEEKKLREVEEWENHKQGKSYRSKLYKPKDEESSNETTPKKPKPKSTFRPNDYNPLMGGGSGRGFQPRQRSSRGG